MDWSQLTRYIPFLATSTWIALGTGFGLGLLLFVCAPWISPSRDKNVKLWEVWRLRGLGVGLACGAFSGSFFLYLFGADRGSPATGFIAVPAVAGALVGQAVAGAIAAAKGREQIDRRVGHSQAVSLRDYVSSPVLWAARILVLTPTLGILLQYVIASFTAPYDFWTGYLLFPAFLVAPALLVLVLTEIGTRILVSRPSSAGSVEALRQHDLRRVQIARDGAGAALGLGVLAFVVAVPMLLSLIDLRVEIIFPATSVIITLAGYGALVCLAISVVLSFRDRALPSRRSTARAS